MSAIDQAFIRAYQAEERLASIASAPAPHFDIKTSPVAALASESVEEPHTSTASPRDRRPLSAFANPQATVEARFKPALEVDHFRWSAVSDELLARHAGRLHSAVQTLIAADDAGRSLIGVAGAAAGVGCTTVLACLARMLVEAGKTVAVVDGNFTSPGLAAHLGLAVQSGWEDVLAGNLPLAESVVYSLGDRIALLPLVSGGAAAAETLDTIHASVTAGVLRYHYDIVLFDLGHMADANQAAIACFLACQCRLDGLVLTCSESTAELSPEHLGRVAPELAHACIGVVENQLRAA